MEVTITVAGLGTVTETLPDGFTYVSSSLDPVQVEVTGQNVQFTVLGTSFTYDVTASSTPDTYSFTGVSNPGGGTVGGDDEVTVSSGTGTTP